MNHLFFEAQKYFFALFNFFEKVHIHNVVLTLIDVVKLDVENNSIVSTLSNVVNINVEIDNVDLTLISTLTYTMLFQRCFDIVTSYHRNSNVQTTLKVFLGIEKCC